jgi:hypothetical protein
MKLTKQLAIKYLKELCKPAYIYFIMSFFSLLLILGQNVFFNKKNKYCVGMFNCAVKTLIPIFLIKIGYIMFWTFILDMLCKNGYTQISWLILLFPFIMFFILIGLFILLE